AKHTLHRNQARKAHEGQSHNSGYNQSDWNSLQWSGDISKFQILPQTSHQYDSQGKANAGSKTKDHTFDETITLCCYNQSQTQNGTVCSNQRQINPQCFI